MERTINYLNLTNGLEYLDEVEDYKLIRIQSSLCEQKCWDKLIQELDYNFLFDLAQGKLVQIYDTSRNKKESRALYQGVEFIRYVLLRRWFNIESTEIQAVVKEHTVTQYFETEYKKLSKNTKKKLDYVKKFVNSNGIHITRVCKKSLYDGQYEYFKRILKQKSIKQI